MYIPDQYSLTSTQRALVTYSNSSTGEIKVKIPSLLGSDSEIFISKVGRKTTSGVWSVPDVGSHIIVSYDDQQLTNVFWMQTDAVSGPTGPTGPTGPVWSSTFTYKVGDTGPGGGTIFFVDRYDEHTGFTYLELAPSSTQVLRTWAQSTPTNYQSTLVSGADSWGLGTGTQNTLDIIAQGNSTASTCAAKYCDNLVFGGKSDWYLPSMGELLLASNTLKGKFGDSTLDGYFWSSTESSAAYTFFLQGGSMSISGAEKSSSLETRAVRKF